MTDGVNSSNVLDYAGAALNSLCFALENTRTCTAAPGVNRSCRCCVGEPAAAFGDKRGFLRRTRCRQYIRTTDGPAPRPALIVQSDLFNETHPSLTVLPLTSEIRSAPQFRIVVEPSATNGLRRISQIMVDKPMTFRRDKIRASIGRMDDETMLRVARALAVWLGIA